MSSKNSSISVGISSGSALAMILSFTINKSILWAVVHGLLGWGYVIWRAFVGGY